MKKLILTALLSGLIYSYGICQGPTLYNYNIVPKINETLISYKVDSTGVTYNNTGANCVWDYSIIDVTTIKMYTYYVDPETSNFISSFQTATIATGIPTNLYYFYADTNEYTLLGSGSLDYIKIYSNPRKYFIFPFNYGSQMLDSFYGTYLENTIQHQESGYQSLVADGWGTLKLPKKTYNNVIRTKMEINGKDSADGEKIEYFSTTINWYDGLHKEPLLTILINKVFNYGNPIPHIYKGINVADFTETVSIPPSMYSLSYNVFPNPANNDLNIELNLNHRTNIDITLVDLNGNIVSSIDKKALELGDYQKTIDISRLPKGIYAVKIISDNEVRVKRIVIQ